MSCFVLRCSIGTGSIIFVNMNTGSKYNGVSDPLQPTATANLSIMGCSSGGSNMNGPFLINLLGPNSDGD